MRHEEKGVHIKYTAVYALLFMKSLECVMIQRMN